MALHTELPIWCDTCEGTGVVHQESQHGVPGSGGDFQCPDCDGRGFNERSYYTTPPAAPAQEPSQPEFFAKLDYDKDFNVLVSVYRRRADATPLLVHQEALKSQEPAAPAPVVQPDPQKTKMFWESEAMRYCQNADYWRKRADKAEAKAEAKAGEALDAKRYRWLRDDRNHFDGGLVVAQSEGEDVLWNKQLDATIDAAMAQKGQTK